MTKPPKQAPPRFMIVQRRPGRVQWLWPALGAVWVASLVLCWAWSVHRVAPGLPRLHQELQAARTQLRREHAGVETLRQREATLALSDRISRVANKEMEAALAAREDEIAELRADVAFYERLVGATAPKKGLNVHSTRFTREDGGNWRYAIVLTQNLDRDAVSLGELRFDIEGVHEGQLATIGWDRLHQAPSAPAREYSFRYFQQIEGSVMLPQGFTPQRVRVSMRGDDVSMEQVLAWNGANNDNGDS